MFEINCIFVLFLSCFCIGKNTTNISILTQKYFNIDKINFK